MASVRPGRKTIDLFCIVCQETYVKELYEHERNERLGSAFSTHTSTLKPTQTHTGEPSESNTTGESQSDPIFGH